MQTLGRKINQARKLAGMRSAELADAIGVSSSSMSYIERDFYKEGPSPATVVKIAEVLDDRTILATYLENNPVYQSIIPKIFLGVGNTHRDPSIILLRFAEEAEKSAQEARDLSDIFNNPGFMQNTNHSAVLKEKLEKIIDIQNCSEVLFLQLILAEVLTDSGCR